ncbi:MAG: phosphonate C-P lyase system protein PhnH, partial [Pseudomonadota bacterium]
DPAFRTATVEGWFRFHCNCPLVEDGQQSGFAIADALSDALDFYGFYIGDAKYPDRSTTLILQVENLEAGEEISLQGPGIPGTRKVNISGLPDHFWTWRKDNHKEFQLGVDVMLTSGSKLLGLPRTTRRDEQLS